MIDVFLCVAEYSGELRRYRYCAANVVHARWELQLDTKLNLITPNALGCSNRDFQWMRRKWAEEQSTSAIYGLVDDDCLPVLPPQDFFMQRICNAFAQHPEFAILSLKPEGINPWTPEGYKTFSDDQVEEHVSVGGIRFMRKGCMKEWPEMTGEGYDGTQGDYIRSTGYRVGFFKHLKCLHLGEGMSTVWGVREAGSGARGSISNQGKGIGVA